MSTTAPQVSVVIPTYNRARFIDLAIRSVQNQTVSDWELIVVDDGSTDGTAEQLESLGEGRLRIIRQENQGQGAARNRGVREARAEWIAFLDSDDQWVPEKLEAQIRYVDEHPSCGMVACAYFSQRNGRRSIRARKGLSGRVFKELFTWNWICTSTVMIRRDAFLRVGGFRNLEPLEDYDLWLRISLDHPLGFIRAPLVIRERGPQQTSQDLECRNGELAIRILESNFDAKLIPESLFSRRLAQAQCRIGRGLLKRGHLGAARERFREARRRAPLYLPAWLGLLRTALSFS